MVNLHKFVIDGSRNRPIAADLTYTDNADKLVIFCHGYKGYKDWGAWNLVAKRFAQEGIAFLKFNFSYNGGTVQQPIDFPDLEAFSENNYSTELDDLILIIRHVLKDESFAYFNPGKLGLIGHSRGGGISVLGASEMPEVACLSTWASVSDFGARFPKGADLIDWRENGVRYVRNGRTNQDMPHGYQFFEDYLDNASRLNIQRACHAIGIPTLFIHGTADQAVSINESKSLQRWLEGSRLFEVEGAEHTFGSYQPYDRDELPEHLEAVTAKTIRFMKRNLS